MQRINTTQAPELAKAAAAVMGLRPHDRERLIDIGVALEAALTDVPAESAELAEMLGLCLEGLQVLYLAGDGAAPGAPEGLPDALATVIIAAERSIRPLDD